MNTVIAVARFEAAEETVVASHYVSAVFSFLPHSIGSPVKVSQWGAVQNLSNALM